MSCDLCTNDRNSLISHVEVRELGSCALFTEKVSIDVSQATEHVSLFLECAKSLPEIGLVLCLSALDRRIMLSMRLDCGLLGDYRRRYIVVIGQQDSDRYSARFFHN